MNAPLPAVGTANPHLLINILLPINIVTLFARDECYFYITREVTSQYYNDINYNYLCLQCLANMEITQYYQGEP